MYDLASAKAINQENAIITQSWDFRVSPRLGWYLFSFPISLSQSQPIFQSISVFLSLSVPSQGLVGGNILWTSGLLQ